MHIVHLTASTLYGGPERQMLGLASHLSGDFRSTFVSFPEGGACGEFLKQAEAEGFPAFALTHDTPRLGAVIRELIALLRGQEADVLVTHGYKANLLGRFAARRCNVPIVGVSRGWTGENLKVRLYEKLDRWNLRLLDHVVAVSEGQAAKVRAAGVTEDRLLVIRNSARFAAFQSPNPNCRRDLQAFFLRDHMPEQIVLAAGRLSPEKGFPVLVEAARQVLEHVPNAGFILFGEGNEREALQQQIQKVGLEKRFLLAGFTQRLDQLIGGADLVAVSSYTEGLPNVVLEANSAGVSVVATEVGGIPEVVVHGETGLLVPPDDATALGKAIRQLLVDTPTRKLFGNRARQRMQEKFSFESQANAYQDLFEKCQYDRLDFLEIART